MLENGNNFQEFTNFLGSEKLRISNKLKIVSDLKGEKRTVFYRYFKTEHLLKSLAEHTLYLASPSSWDDPFETKYMESLDNIGLQKEEDTNTLKEYSVFATCFKGESAKVNEEAVHISEQVPPPLRDDSQAIFRSKMGQKGRVDC